MNEEEIKIQGPEEEPVPEEVVESAQTEEPETQESTPEEPEGTARRSVRSFSD